MFNKKFDLIVSIGEDCACASFLGKTKLRDASYPMDWLCHATFEKRIQLICSKFDGFLQKQNMRHFPKPQSGLRDLKNENYEDTANGFYFYHDFASDIAFEDSFPLVKSKYDRRVARFYENICKNKNVLLVWWSRDKIIDNEVLLQSQKQISAFFNKNIYLLAIENKSGCNDIKEEQISDFVIKYTADIIGNTTTTWGNEKISMQIFKQIRHRIKYRTMLKNILVRGLTIIIPVKKWRKKIRKFFAV